MIITTTIGRFRSMNKIRGKDEEARVDSRRQLSSLPKESVKEYGGGRSSAGQTLENALVCGQTF